MKDYVNACKYYNKAIDNGIKCSKDIKLKCSNN